MDSVTLTARFLFPVSSPPIERGTITIQDGRFLSIEPPGSRHPDFDLGNVAVLPGLVNAHTHLDLSGMKGLMQPVENFVQWLRGVVQYRRRLSPEKTGNDIRMGIAESLRYGVTLIGDISSKGLSYEYLANSPVHSVVFYELIGLPSDRAELAKREAEDWLDRYGATAACRLGLSPHAPYSVRSSLFEAAFELARKHQIPLATHLGETLEELELLEQQKGPFVDFLTDLGVWDPEGLIHGPNEVLHQGNLPARFLIVHGNYLMAHSVGVENGKGTIVYCPRTHAAFGHAPHPFLEILSSGGPVALGTHSLASNPDLNILSEARFIRRFYPDFPGDQLLRMITLSGSEALGWDTETGSLTSGKLADLVVLPLPSADSKDPHDLLFDSDYELTGVMWRGSWTHSDNSFPVTPDISQVESSES